MQLPPTNSETSYHEIKTTFTQIVVIVWFFNTLAHTVDDANPTLIFQYNIKNFLMYLEGTL
jgi:hypothetical protein